jgi:hypothetical protein
VENEINKLIKKLNEVGGEVSEFKKELQIQNLEVGESKSLINRDQLSVKSE